MIDNNYNKQFIFKSFYIKCLGQIDFDNNNFSITLSVTIMNGSPSFM